MEIAPGHHQPQPMPPPDQMKRPRGRPKGSKTINRRVLPGQPRGVGKTPKEESPLPVMSTPPVAISSSVYNVFLPQVLHLRDGEDIAGHIAKCQGNAMKAVALLAAFGKVQSATVHQPAAAGGTMTYQGNYEILSLHGSYVPGLSPEGAHVRTGGLTVQLMGADGQIVGGIVMGLLIASGPVTIVLGSFAYNGPPKPRKARQSKKSGIPTTAAPSGQEEQGGLLEPIITHEHVAQAPQEQYDSLGKPETNF